ncbi:hypothetical protein QEH59_00295 [Coraliomargarita sp. SDUM461004]|uniref:Carbohydrate kinase PfkB domain-containing protein n=1 Tax=Thalassobacterium sedimentorum TaxID=3041258 RepID=A0ABU1ADP1_9BACT|nr:hypothetical protein [Coraliomargarita sp. SDUM461004]MDQ8192842.1 hypothetical protein [Coraliomargarita sp. SDUM461004]
MNTRIYTSINELSDELETPITKILHGADTKPKGITGFDGFIDTFIRMEQPSTMAELGPKITAAAGIAASYPVQHNGDKFGGNGPLLTSALHGIYDGQIDLTYIGAMGRDTILPIFEDALSAKTTRLYSLAEPAHSDCLEFDDGKVMLSDMRSCADITWERLIETVGADALDQLLSNCDFIGAVNWGKLPHVGKIWSQLAGRLQQLGIRKKQLPFFMDLAEFEQRPREDMNRLLEELPAITTQCHTILSFNLKEAWQMGAYFGGEYSGQKSPQAVAELAGFLRKHIDVDRIIIHPNDGAACASKQGIVYIPGPVVKKPLISTGAGDNFGAGCLSGTLLGLDDIGILLCGVCSSGYFVRTGASPTFAQIGSLIKRWQSNELPERL